MVRCHLRTMNCVRVVICLCHIISQFYDCDVPIMADNTDNVLLIPIMKVGVHGVNVWLTNAQ